MDVPLDAAFAEACRALGEAAVRERLLTAELQRLHQLLATHGEPAPGEEGL